MSSITYGSFSSPLHRTVSAGVGSGTSILFTIPWEPASYVNRIRIWTTDTTSLKIDSMQIATDNGHLANGTPNQSFYYLYSNDVQQDIKANSGYSASYELNPSVHHVNLYNRPYLNVRVILNTASIGTFYCYAEGRKSYPAIYEKTYKTNVLTTTAYRVILGTAQTGTGGTGGVITDVTEYSIGNSVNANIEDFTINSANDYIYIGSKKKVTHWELGIGTGSTTATALKGEYWSGTAWTTFTVQSNTSSNSSNALRYSGVCEGVGLGSSAWLPVKFDPATNILLPNDPKTILQNSITNGLEKPITFFENDPKYWVRLSATSLAEKLYINKVLPIGEDYGAL